MEDVSIYESWQIFCVKDFSKDFYLKKTFKRDQRNL